MRIVAGRLKGRRFTAPSGRETRPTSDRVREALFDLLVHGVKAPLEGVTVLDLFAGTGGLALEALSRGAARAVLVDNEMAARNLIRTNVAALGEEARCVVLLRDARKLGPRPDDVAAAAVVFVDPPYRKKMASAALASAAEGGWLAPGAMCVVESEADEGVEEPPAGFDMVDDRNYGDSRIRFFAYPGPSND